METYEALKPPYQCASMMIHSETVKRQDRPLLAALSERLEDSDLRLIASCDYGMDIEKHYAPLLRLTETLETQNLDFWFPMEVVELCRWSGDFRDLKDEFPDHEKRAQDRVAFCCTVILHTFCDSKCELSAFDSTLGNLVESLLRLDLTLLDTAGFLFERLLNTTFRESSFSLLNAKYIEEYEKALTHVAQLLPILRTKDETRIQHHLDALLQLEDQAGNGIRGDTFANKKFPQVSTGWRYVGGYIAAQAKDLADASLQHKLLELSTRLWSQVPVELGDSS